MKKLGLVVALVAMAAAPALAGPLGPDKVAVGDIITVTDYYNGSSGGPFQVNNQTVGKPDGWLTFCVETNEYLNFGVGLKVVGVTDRAMYGSVGPSGDVLDARTAYLYTKYRAMGGSMTSSLNDAYQAAIWFIEGEGGSNNYLVAEANAAVAVGGSWYGKGLGDVRVMNLVWNQDNSGFKKGDRAQDLLTMVPDGGTTLALLGLALAGLGALRRRLN